MHPEVEQDPVAPARAPASADATAIAIPDRWWRWGVLALAGGGFLLGVGLWQRLSSIQEQLARQSADSATVSAEARALAKQAQDIARDAAARQAVSDARLSEVALQRSQLEELMQSLSRSRDENLVVDIESALRLALQQSQLTGSVEPLLAALRTAEQRITRAAQPRLSPVLRALARDIERVKAATVTDLPGLLLKIDELVRLADEVPVANAVAVVRPSPRVHEGSAPSPVDPQWWRDAVAQVLDELRALVRVGRIDQPEAVLLSPDQAFFVRENLKLKLLNARLGIFARQHVSARADMSAAVALLGKYFDPGSRKTQNALAQAQQVQSLMKALELPRVDESLAALATAAAGR